MIIFKRLVLLLGCLCLLIGISGCGDKPATLSVRLPVTVNGKVPEGATDASFLSYDPRGDSAPLGLVPERSRAHRDRRASLAS